ncbi:unnamed protein product [Laminaria digitata]
MSKALAQEVASRGITVNCVAPGFVESPMTDALNDDQRQSLAAAIPTGRFGTAADIAASVLYLASEEAAYVTGQTLHVLIVGKPDIADRVKKIVVEHLGVDEEKVTDSASFIDDLGADSLDTVELVMAFEEAFGCEIPDDAAEKIVTVKDAVAFLQSAAS